MIDYIQAYSKFLSTTGYSEILTDPAVKVFWNLSSNMINEPQFGYCYVLDCTLVQYSLSDQDSFSSPLDTTEKGIVQYFPNTL